MFNIRVYYKNVKRGVIIIKIKNNYMNILYMICHIDFKLWKWPEAC